MFIASWIMFNHEFMYSFMWKDPRSAASPLYYIRGHGEIIRIEENPVSFLSSTVTYTPHQNHFDEFWRVFEIFLPMFFRQHVWFIRHCLQKQDHGGVGHLDFPLHVLFLDVCGPCLLPMPIGPHTWRNWAYRPTMLRTAGQQQSNA